MSPEHYIDLCLVAVPTAKREAYHQHAAAVAAVVKQHGVLQVVECWGDDVPTGQRTSLPLAVQCQPDETVACSWFVWPDKATREAGWARSRPTRARLGTFRLTANAPSSAASCRWPWVEPSRSL